MHKSKENGEGQGEQRAEERYACVGTVLLYESDSETEADGGPRRAQVQDMSLSGLSFDVSAPLPVGHKLVLLIRQSDGQGQERLMAEVRWCEPIRAGGYRVGVRIESSAVGSMAEAASVDAPADSIVGVLTSYRQVMLDGGPSGKQ